MTTHKKIAWTLLLAGAMAGCTKNLDRAPEFGLTNEVLYKNEAGYRSAVAKIYAGLSLTGNSGPSGSGDIQDIDEGFSSYVRNYFNMQELTTDEAVIAWDDRTIQDLHHMDWSSNDVFIGAFYSRIYFQITLANAFVKESADGELSRRGITGADADKVRGYRNEARALRALSYLHAIDMFGSPGFVTEADGIGAFLPKQGTRAEVFAYIESECKALETLLPEPRANEYGRMDRAAVWMILANLYLNAQVYTGTARFTDAVTYSKKVMDAGYTLEPNYRHLFLADNHRSRELIFAIPFDGIRSRTWGGTTYLTRAPIGGRLTGAPFGVIDGWGGLRTTSALVDKFADISGNTDRRAQFFTDGQSKTINNLGLFTDGFAITKWRNVTSTGAAGSNNTWVDTDFPLFRLAEANLIFAEAILRGGTGASNEQAVNAINALRVRAFGNSTGNVGSINLQLVLDERARELHWEGKRRTDLIRYGQFTTAAYLWPWKGNTLTGRAVESFRDLFPIPSAEVNSNPNMKQNPGY
ncbi:MAG: RagB/SusD family nutrient uptake outer membrane protein [Bacteroidetes bacterium]|nr:MAG: RagB/SusD family nutrient uptake outer membrane protein [Bacteroidota bacterium]